MRFSWTRVVDLGTFNSDEGRALQRVAKAKLERLPSSIDTRAAERIFRFYLSEAPSDLWPATATFRSAHVAAFLRTTTSDTRLPALLLRAAHEEGARAGFRRMGELVKFAASGVNVPALLSRARYFAPRFQTDETIAAAQRILPTLEFATVDGEILLHAAALWLALQQRDEAFALAIELQHRAWDDAKLGYESNLAHFELVKKAAR